MKNNYDDDDFKVVFVLYMMGTVLCPTSEFGVNKRFLHALKDTSTISKLDWSQFVLEFLTDGIKSYKEKGRNVIHGCLLFLMLFYSEHCTSAKDFSSRCEDRPSPRLSAWGDKEIRNRICWLNQKVEQKLNVIMEVGVGKRQRAVNQGKEIDQNEPIGELTHRVRELTSVVEEVVVLMREKDTKRKDKKASKHKDRNVKEPSHMKTNEDKKGSKEAISDDVTSPLKTKIENDSTKPSPMKTNEDKIPNEPTLKTSTKKLRRMAAHIRESLSSTAPPPIVVKNKMEKKLRTSRFKESQPVKANAKEKPFTSYPPMSEVEKLIIRYAFDQSLSVREQLCNLGMEHATRAEFLTLQQGAWISSSIINLVAVKKTLVQRDRDPNGIWPSWYLPTYFADYALGRGQDVISWVKQYSGNNKYTGIVKECERVYIPINEDKSHWYMCVVNFTHGMVYILDSLSCPSKKKERNEQVMCMVKFLDEVLDILDNDEKRQKVQKLPFHRPTWLPVQQSGSGDCGLHTAKFYNLENFTEEESFMLRFNSEDGRYRLALELIVFKDNKTRTALIKKAQEKYRDGRKS
ncbi:hypothetical protein Vadar_026474 [Vaccinium darrowii]|uniref:Uncharacterized protein n=1 Tax=Vaccinium darrowii TaxID=229202 RepID=A0ACB7XCH3_9ERIC|nr:hypothetical protein Vadar_026474 [Vaccinium darrowii]